MPSFCAAVVVTTLQYLLLTGAVTHAAHAEHMLTLQASLDRRTRTWVALLQVYFVTNVSAVPPPPSGPGSQPPCPPACRYNFAPYGKAFLRETYGRSGFELPPTW